MKKLLLALMVIAVAGVAQSALLNKFQNGDLEVYGDDGYGRIMPTGWGLATTGGNWGNIPYVETTTTDAQSGSASVWMDTYGSASWVVLEQELQRSVGQYITGYRVTAWIKGTADAGSVVGFDMFDAARTGWWWGGGVDIEGTWADWTEFSYDIFVGAESAWNVKIASGGGGSDFKVDNITVENIPEPATFSLLAVAGGALMLLRRRISRF